jgi:cyclopropane fatty-acyl-phospholipid synthase-like methyltransferase
MREYDLIADWYPSDRGHTAGVAQALALAATLGPRALILDLGCGNGVPVTRALVDAGHRVVGLDSSANMLGRFRLNLPETRVVRADARQFPFAADRFDAAFSWGMLFHLTRADQSAVLAGLSSVLARHAPFLFTAAEIENASDAGITGTMNGVTFPYYAVPSYSALLAEHGFALERSHDEPRDGAYYLARKM